MSRTPRLKGLFDKDFAIITGREVLSSLQTGDNASRSTRRNTSVAMARDYKRTTGNASGMSPRAKILMVLIAIVTLVAIWLVPGDKKETPPALPEMAPPPQAEQPVPLPLPSVGKDESAAKEHEGDRARAIVAKLRAGNTEPDSDEVFARAQQLQSEGQTADAYLLYRFAASQGHAQAALVLGTQADPAFYTSETSVLPEPDPQQAYKWYRAAAAAGNEEAVERLQQLREHVEQSAVDGNAAARRLMLQWR
jgi:hypothetical protein